MCAGEAFSQKDSYFPQVFFDKKQAEAQLGAGKSTIEGVAFTRKKNHTFYNGSSESENR